MPFSRTRVTLTPKEKDFCHQYIIKHFNGQQAAIAAGFAKGSADITAAQLLSIPRVQQQVAALIEKHFTKQDITIGRIAEELGKVAFARITDLVEIGETEVRLKPATEFGDAVDTIATVEIDDGRVYTETEEGERQQIGGALKTKVKMLDKLKALELLGKWQKMFVQVVEHGGSVEIKQAEAADEAYRQRFARKKK
jgi:phage terminase small subunit